MIAKISLLCLLAVALVHSAPLDKGKLKFKVSGRNLPDKDTGLGTTDGYFEVFSSADGGRTKTKITRSDTINDKENPDWGNVIEFNFDRNKNELLYFKVYDEDNLREDDTVGRVWINVNDYVDKGQLTTANLDKGGHLIIQSVDAQKPEAGATRGQIPLPAGTPETQNLRFKLSASGLPTKDDVGFLPGNSDPYVMIYSTEGPTGKETSVGRTSTVTSSSNPTWGDTFSFSWDKKKDQRWHFKIYDDDKLQEDDKLGSGWVEVSDFVARGQSYTLALPKKGSLTISKA